MDEVERLRLALNVVAERAFRAWAINPPSTVVLMQEMREIEEYCKDILKE